MLLAEDMKALKKAVKELLYEESRLYQRVGSIAICSSIVDVESFEGGLKLPYWWLDIAVNQRKFDLRIILNCLVLFILQSFKVNCCHLGDLDARCSKTSNDGERPSPRNICSTSPFKVVSQCSLYM